MATTTAIPVPRRASKLTIEEFGKCNRAAQLDGTLYGSSAGFLGGLFGYRFLKLNKNVSLFGGLLTGVVSGYVITQQALITRIARAEADAEAAQRKRDEEKGGKYDMNRGESGFGGMETFEDKYATTSGEH